MKKRKLLTAVTVLALCFSLCLTAFAGDTGKTGQTSGGSAGILKATAHLTANTNSGTATTTCKDVDDVELKTTIIYYYTNSNGQEGAVSAAGGKSITVGGDSGKGRRATSQHTVDGGKVWGKWSCGLSTSAF